ncbi:thiamine-binding protein [Lentibacillus lipolyticus]|nr:thiamine-binding protein [Lentibacillus lipolyticus]
MTNQACYAYGIFGASFSIHPMTSQFIDVIKGALAEADTSKVHMQTDDVTTTVRGRMVHVFDVTKAIFLHAAKTGEHVAFQATYSYGCPGDSTGDAYMAADEDPMNNDVVRKIRQPAAAKFSLYPLSGSDYMDTIYEQIEAMKQHVTVRSAHYSTRLDGETAAIFDGLENVFQSTVESGSEHTVMTVSISVNSPSHQGGNDER